MTENQSAANRAAEPFSFPEINTDILLELLTAVKTGAVRFLAQDPRINQLAAQISALVVENEYLKKILGVTPPPPTLTVAPQMVTIVFGTNSEYTLTLPVTTAEDRRVLADQLFYAAMDLKRQESELAQQLKLPLVFEA
jgi:hypothetical protein